MQTRRTIIAVVAIVAAAGAWYVFRPERLFLDRVVNEAATGDAAMAVAAGDFHSNAHATTGRATIQRAPDGTLTLRLSGFETSNGPDVRVILVAATDVTDDATVRSAGFLDLGGMKGNIGDQNYTVPQGTDLARYRAVTIWCRRFGVNFGTAPLVS